MKSKLKLISLVMGVFILLLATLALAEDFSADMINTGQGGAFKGKIFVSGDKTRMEIPDGITITRMDKQVIWILMPNEKMYMEQAFDPMKAMATSAEVSGEIERNLIGKEMIDGKMADKYEIVYEYAGRRGNMFQWFASGLKIPVKIAAGDNSWIMEYKNIKMGKQPDALFEVPADYQKFSYDDIPSMGDMLKGLGN